MRRKSGDAVIPENPPGGGCEFEEWHREQNTMDTCGRQVYGYIGKNRLCERHFYYVAGMSGIGERDIRRVK